LLVYSSLSSIPSLPRSVLANTGVSTEAQELVNLATIAELIATCALQRKESRGGHYVLDYPNPVERERRPSMVSLFPTVPKKAPAPAVLAPVGLGSSSSKGSNRFGSPPKKKAVARELTVIRSLKNDDM